MKIALHHERLFCANQQAAVFAGAKSSFSIYHTASAKQQIEEVRRALSLSFKFDAAFEAAAEAMIREALDLDTFRRVCAEITGAEEGEGADKGAQKGRWARVDAMTGLFRDSENLENIRGTHWAGYQAITEFYDHYAPVDGKRNADDVRAQRIVSGQLDGVKARAFELLSV